MRPGFNFSSVFFKRNLAEIAITRHTFLVDFAICEVYNEEHRKPKVGDAYEAFCNEPPGRMASG